MICSMLLKSGLYDIVSLLLLFDTSSSGNDSPDVTNVSEKTVSILIHHCDIIGEWCCSIKRYC